MDQRWNFWGMKCPLKCLWPSCSVCWCRVCGGDGAAADQGVLNGVVGVDALDCAPVEVEHQFLEEFLRKKSLCWDVLTRFEVLVLHDSWPETLTPTNFTLQTFHSFSLNVEVEAELFSCF